MKNIRLIFIFTCSIFYAVIKETCSTRSKRSGIPNTSGKCSAEAVVCGENRICKDTPDSYVCVCSSGYQYIDDVCTDTNECSSNKGGCDQNCRNHLGSYACSCRSGFTLDDDGASCRDTRTNYIINGTTGIITTPNYPHNYPNNMECTRKIVTTPGHRIVLKFKEFEMEKDAECRYDRVQIYDGGTTSTRQLGVFCGTQARNVTSFGNEMMMLLKSDGGDTKAGFLSQFDTICGGTLYPSSTVKKIFSHANFGSGKYKPNQHCKWQIRLKSGTTVELRFASFSLEPKNKKMNCTDFVEIKDAYDVTDKLCGFKQLPAAKQYSWTDDGQENPSVNITFVTDDMIERSGFELEYRKVEEPLADDIEIF